MLAPRLLLAANSRRSPHVVHALGASGDAEALERAARGGDTGPYEYSYVVLGLPDRHAKGVKDAAGLRSSREHSAGIRWIAGTFAAWWRATDLDDVDAETRAGLAAALQQATGLTPFGNPRYIGTPPKWVQIPGMPDYATAMGDVWGGLVEVSLDRLTEDALVRAGARVLRRGIEIEGVAGANVPSRTADSELPRRVIIEDVPELVSCGSLVLPYRRDSITDADHRLLNAYAAAYHRLMRGCSNPDIVAALRLPFEVSRLIVAVETSALRALLREAHPPAIRAAEQLLALFGAPVQRPGQVSDAA